MAIKQQAQLPLEIRKLQEVIEGMPLKDQRLTNALVGIITAHERKHRVLTLVKDALAQLRLDMKYLVFDLEATRRERDDFRRQLEEAS